MQIAEKDDDEMVCLAARDRLSEISEGPGAASKPES
jgi:hypothetical protein